MRQEGKLQGHIEQGKEVKNAERKVRKRKCRGIRRISKKWRMFRGCVEAVRDFQGT